jgi:uncharacterized membrane protein YgaE (UPF0421/DUF939 family)
MLTGMSTGIVVGFLESTYLGFAPVVQIMIGSMAAMLASAAFGISAITFIQAAAAAILVGIGGEGELGAINRLTEAFIGVSVALIMSQVLFTPDPTRRIERHLILMFRELAHGLRLSERALLENDSDCCQRAATHYQLAIRRSLEVVQSIRAAQSSSRSSVKGHLQAQHLEFLTRQYERLVVELTAHALSLNDHLREQLTDAAMRPDFRLRHSIHRLLRICRLLENRPEARLAQALLPEILLAQRRLLWTTRERRHPLRRGYLRRLLPSPTERVLCIRAGAARLKQDEAPRRRGGGLRRSHRRPGK